MAWAMGKLNAYTSIAVVFKVGFILHLLKYWIETTLRLSLTLIGYNMYNVYCTYGIMYSKYIAFKMDTVNSVW